MKPLSPREMEICKLMASGHTQKETAAKLFISPKTVSSHWNRCQKKLGLSDQIHLVHFALSRGWITNLYANEPNG